MAEPDDVLRLIDDADAPPQPDGSRRWKIAVIDDDPAVHDGTRFALSDYRLNGQGLEIISAFSAAEGREVMRKHADIAAVLLDVIMETDSAGLDLVQFIRNEIKNETVRIILRTGQPGQAPERRVIVDYDINDYKAKTELTADKLFTSLTAALRSYQQLQRMLDTRRGLEVIIDAASTLYDFKSMQRLAEGVLMQLASLLDVDCAGILVVRDDGTSGDGISVLAGSGCYSRFIGARDANVLDAELRELVDTAFRQRRHDFKERRSILYICTGSGREVVVLLEAEKHLSDTDRALVEIFSSRLAIAFDNVILYEKLQEANSRLEERVVQRTRDLTSANRRLAVQWARLQRANGFKSEILGTVAHDLKNPLGVILGRTEMLKEMTNSAASSPESVQAQIDHIREADQAADGDGRQPDRRRHGRRARHHDPARAGRSVGSGPGGRGDEPADGRRQGPDHFGVDDSGSQRPVRYRPHARSARQPPEQRHQVQPDRRPYRSHGRTQGWAYPHPGAGRGRRTFSRRHGTPVRPVPAAVGQADRRREFDRARPLDRQANRRVARRLGPCRESRTGTRHHLPDDVAGVMTQVAHIAQHICVVDDEAAAREMVGDYLRMHGFTITLCDGGPSLRQAIAQQMPDLVVLDLNMPQEDGLSIIRDLKQHAGLPIIMLTATASPIDRVVGLELGADDYLAKPCEMRELLARIRSVLRRSAAAKPAATAAADAPVRFGTKWLDLAGQALRDQEGNEHPLTPSEFTLLKAFADNPKRVLSRERLLELANARDSDTFDRAVDLRIMRLRRKIEPDPRHPSVIRTVRGGGYLFSPGSGEKS